MGKRPFVRFYQQDWACDKFVRSLNMEERGTYFTLLVRQMIDGYIDNNPADLMDDLKAPTLEEATRLLSPKIMSKFKQFPEDPTRLFNQRLKDVIDESDAARVSGSIGGYKKSSNSKVESPTNLESAAEQFDFSPIMREMPRRRVNGEVEGWDQGVHALKYITTREEYNDLLEAVKNYARTRRGQNAATHYRFDNFVNGKYHEYVRSKKSTEKVEDKRTEKTTVIEMYANTDAKIEALRRTGKTIPDVPWRPDKTASDEHNEQRAARWTEDDRAGWLTKFLETGDV